MRLVDKRTAKGEAPKPPEGEPLSQYFSPDRSYKYVTRGEFYSLLGIIEQARTNRIWYRRLWRWLVVGITKGHVPRIPDIAKAARQDQGIVTDLSGKRQP